MTNEAPSPHRRKSHLIELIEDLPKFKFDRAPTDVAGDPEYIRSLPRIRDLYASTEYWHGTGRYKYNEDGEINDILKGIILENGLRPHEDEWDRSRGVMHSISVTPARMYARLYAGMYCPAATRIRNELGSRELWGYRFLGVSGLVGMFEYMPNLRRMRLGDDSTSLIPGYREKSKRWTAKVTAQKHDLKHTFLYGTDIGENYPILIGIKHGFVQSAQTSRFIGLHEKRSEIPISLDQISHIEVPQSRVAETKAMLESAGYPDIEILPIEFGEEYCRQFSFRHLASGTILK